MTDDAFGNHALFRGCDTMKTADLDFDLPPRLIAQAPAVDRAASRLLHYRRSDRSISHRRFSDLPSLLRPGDLLVLNNARVVPARFALIKPTGGRVEGLFLSQTSPRQWRVLLRSPGTTNPKTELAFEHAPDTTARVIEKFDAGECLIELPQEVQANVFLERVGRMPLPPYIKRDKFADERDAFDRERYQTVYAEASGSVAAPTAGLHFDDRVFNELETLGVDRTFVTLHVGLSTFKPVTADALDDHVMHTERYTIDQAAADRINHATRDGRRVIAVGTTAARVLESQPANRPIEPVTRDTNIFIRPPYAWKWIDGLVTNFHLPRSTLIALVAAWVGLDEQRRIYADAIANDYRFFSYGDSSFLE